MRALWQAMRKTVAEEGSAILVTVLAVEGSAPREVGARMIVSASGIRGTIGGGALEHDAWQSAQNMLANDAPQAFVSRHALGPDLGQCCGGRVALGFEYFERHRLALLSEWASREAAGWECRTEFAQGPHAMRVTLAAGDGHARLEKHTAAVFIERFSEQRQTLHLFGAGHVGKAIVMALAPLPFKVSWYDERREMFPSHVPANATPIILAHPDGLPFASDDFILIMTHSHPLDLALVTAALRSPARFIGLIGSATKKARFQSRLRAAGFTNDIIARLVCPIGVAGISGKEPAMIAAAVTAQLLIMREQMMTETVRREQPFHRRVAMGVGV